MYTNILIPTDGSELAEKAVQHGIALAKRIGAKRGDLAMSFWTLPFVPTSLRSLLQLSQTYKQRT
jgi:nucleotide-binding universal stress UspA family protein